MGLEILLQGRLIEFPGRIFAALTRRDTPGLALLPQPAIQRILADLKDPTGLPLLPPAHDIRHHPLSQIRTVRIAHAACYTTEYYWLIVKLL